MSDTLTAIVTGAGSGIGRATALALAAQGYALALVGRNEMKLRETQTLIDQQHGTPAIIIAADIAQPFACRHVIETTHAKFGRLDALANVAGHAALSTIAKVTDQMWRSTIDINVTSIVQLTAAAWPLLAKQGGTIVNVSSMASVDPFPQFAIYAAAKAAVNMFTRCTAMEGAKENIKAVTVAPGAVETPMLRALFNEKMIPKDKALSPQDVATVIVDCITGKRAFNAGETILVKSP